VFVICSGTFRPLAWFALEMVRHFLKLEFHHTMRDTLLVRTGTAQCLCVEGCGDVSGDDHTWRYMLSRRCMLWNRCMFWKWCML
jgi:hypothetical protein